MCGIVIKFTNSERRKISMIDFKKNPKLGVFTYGLLLLSCLLEISVELGLHEFEDFASHHGLAIFAFGSLFGFTGLLVAVPTSAIISVIFKNIKIK